MSYQITSAVDAPNRFVDCSIWSIVSIQVQFSTFQSYPRMCPAETTVNRATIQALTRPIVQRFDPEQVIHFGSYRRGEADEHSDLDLLLVLRPGVEPRRPGNRIGRAIVEHFVLPVDLLIRCYETFTTYRPNPNSMLSRMLEVSEVLYDRHAA